MDKKLIDIKAKAERAKLHRVISPTLWENVQDIGKRNPTIEGHQVLTEIAKDAFLTSMLLKAFEMYGQPAELLFITADGQKFNLKNGKSLGENELCNILLDTNNP